MDSESRPLYIYYPSTRLFHYKLHAYFIIKRIALRARHLAGVDSSLYIYYRSARLFPYNLHAYIIENYAFSLVLEKRRAVG